MRLSLTLSALLSLSVSCHALPSILARQTTAVALSPAEIAAFAPYTQFARAAYCPWGLESWKCGGACAGVPDFELTLVGGDGNDVQTYFVGYWPTQDTVIVSHEGTNPAELVSMLTDANIMKVNLDPFLFPGVPRDIEVHAGFALEHSLTARTILAEVSRLMAWKGTARVTIAGHSLGGALAELDALYLILNLPANAEVQAITFGTPRVGNAAFAAFFDSKVSSFKRINNLRDVVPIVPGRLLGFEHPKGEIHIVTAEEVISCPGEEDATDADCSIMLVPSLEAGNIMDHLGPYEGIYIGTMSCAA